MASAEGLFARWGHGESYFRWSDRLHRVAYWKRRERQEALRLIQELAPRTVLDFGCNNGFLSASIQAGMGAEVTLPTSTKRPCSGRPKTSPR